MKNFCENKKKLAFVGKMQAIIEKNCCFLTNMPYCYICYLKLHTILIDIGKIKLYKACINQEQLLKRFFIVLRL